MEQPTAKQNEFVNEQEFRDNVALQFDMLRSMDVVISDVNNDFAQRWQQTMNTVLANYQIRLESGESTQEHYDYVVNFWLDNVNTRNNPLTPID